MKKTIFILTALFFFMFLFTSCGNSSNRDKYIGKWKVVSGKFIQPIKIDISLRGDTFVLNKDGCVETYRFSYGLLRGVNIPENITYIVNSDHIYYNGD